MAASQELDQQELDGVLKPNILNNLADSTEHMCEVQMKPAKTCGNIQTNTMTKWALLKQIHFPTFYFQKRQRNVQVQMTTVYTAYPVYSLKQVELYLVRHTIPTWPNLSITMESRYISGQSARGILIYVSSIQLCIRRRYLTDFIFPSSQISSFILTVKSK